LRKRLPLKAQFPVQLSASGGAYGLLDGVAYGLPFQANETVNYKFP
jgi:hypothetical protein